MDDPLGAQNGLAPLPVIEHSDIANWASTTAQHSREYTEGQPVPRFGFRDDLNKLVALWKGNALHVKAAALVNTTNESITDRQGLCGDIFERGGADLRSEVGRLDGCRTGESKQTLAFNLNCNHIIHTVGPRYNLKYQTAAENALHSCYRSVLQTAAELSARTIVIPIINVPKRGYPRAEGCHVALRTVRRCLEHFSANFDLIIFSVDSDEDEETYKNTMPLYFPRSESEARWSDAHLPEDIGNEFGERVIEERKIRIGNLAQPVADADSEDVKVEKVSSHAAVQAFSNSSTSNIKPSVDKKDEITDRIYQRLLNKARSEDMSDVARRGMIFFAGQDNNSNNVFVLVGSLFPMADDLKKYEKMVMYAVRTFEANHAQTKDFIVVYFHANANRDQVPDLSQLKLLYNMFERKFLKRFKKMYIVHPSFWIKVTLTLLRPWMDSKFSDNIVYLDRLSDVYQIVSSTQIKIPKEIVQYDREENGLPAAKNDGL